MTTLEQVRGAMRALERYAEDCVPKGGVNPSHDARWVALTRKVVHLHDRWRKSMKFPGIWEGSESMLPVSRWAARFPLNQMSAQHLAKILCHIDVLRCLEIWPDTVQEPLDAFWWPVTGPQYVAVPNTVWKIATAKPKDPDPDSSWLGEMLATTIAVTGARSPKELEKRIDPSNPHLTDELPGLLVSKWLQRNSLCPSPSRRTQPTQNDWTLGFTR